MARPPRCRRICGLPRCRTFGPLGESAGAGLRLGVDELECLRLIDLLGLSQEACARQMEVARTTVTGIYESARRKVARALVEGRTLEITGGAYRVCAWGGASGGCPWAQELSHAKKERTGIMKIAVTYENGQIFQHFGHTEFFKLYTVENGAVADSRVISSGGEGHGALAGLLREQGVDTLICGGIGGGARQALTAAGIQLYGGVSGQADEAVQALLNGTLRYDPDVQCRHHEGEGGHGHSCGGHGHHGCGGHHGE